jgi:hypothetical protein
MSTASCCRHLLDTCWTVDCWTEVDVSATRIKGKINEGPRILFCLNQFRLVPEV